MSDLNVKTRTLKIAKMGIMVAASVICSFIHFPILPAAPWMEFEASAIPILIAGFVFGPVRGVIIGVVAIFLRAIITGPPSGPHGLIMNIIATVVVVFVAAAIYQKTMPKTEKVNAAASELFGLINNSQMSSDFHEVLFKRLKLTLSLMMGKWGLISLIVGGLCATVAMIPANLIVTPLFLNASTEQVIGMILPVLLPFNLLKMVINTVIVYLLYKRLSPFLHKW